jgi:hypothetical protein
MLINLRIVCTFTRQRWSSTGTTLSSYLAWLNIKHTVCTYCLSPPPNWDSPTPHMQASVYLPPPFWFRGVDRGVPIRTRGQTLWLCTL